MSDGARVAVPLGVPAVADALGLSLGVAVGLLDGVSLGLKERVSGRDIVLGDETVSDGARVVVSLGVPAVADALGLSLGVAVGLLDGVSLGLKERVSGRDIVLADETVSDGTRVAVSLGVPAVADALGLSLGVAVGLLENVSLGLKERVSGRDIVLGDETVSDGARVAVPLGVPAVADALGLSLGVAVGLLDGVSLGLKERVSGRDIVRADETVSDGTRVAVSLGVTAVADALGLPLGVAVGLPENVSLGLKERVSGRDIVLADETVSDGARVAVSRRPQQSPTHSGSHSASRSGCLMASRSGSRNGSRVATSSGQTRQCPMGQGSRSCSASHSGSHSASQQSPTHSGSHSASRSGCLSRSGSRNGSRVATSSGQTRQCPMGQGSRSHSASQQSPTHSGSHSASRSGCLMNVSLGLSERVSGRDIVRADETVSDGARVAVSLGVPAVADALGLSLGVAVGLLDGVSLGLKERVSGRDIVRADEAVSDGARVAVPLGVPAVADALGLSLGVAVGLLDERLARALGTGLGSRHRPG